MLQEIKIAGEASYANGVQSLGGLRPINFIFGTNGSGKTTISRVIADSSARPTCTLVWSGGSALESLVYNSDFSARNFAAQMPGIFTLGEAEAGTLAAIEAKTRLVASLNDDIQRLENTLGPPDGASGKRGELRSLRLALEDRCWTIKSTHDPHFQEAFAGVRNSKSNFCDKSLTEWAGNSAGIVSIDDLKKRALTVFAKGLERLTLLAPFDAAELIALEQVAVLGKKVTRSPLKPFRCSYLYSTMASKNCLTLTRCQGR